MLSIFKRRASRIAILAAALGFMAAPAALARTVDATPAVSTSTVFPGVWEGLSDQEYLAMLRVEDKTGVKICKVQEDDGSWSSNNMECSSRLYNFTLDRKNGVLMKSAKNPINALFNWRFPTGDDFDMAKAIEQERRFVSAHYDVRTGMVVDPKARVRVASNDGARPVQVVAAKPKRALTVAERRGLAERVLATMDIKTDDAGVSYVERYGKRYDLKVTQDGTTVVAGNMRLTFGSTAAGEKANRIYWRNNNVPAAATQVAYKAPVESSTAVASLEGAPLILADYGFGNYTDIGRHWTLTGFAPRSEADLAWDRFYDQVAKYRGTGQLLDTSTIDPLSVSGTWVSGSSDLTMAERFGYGFMPLAERPFIPSLLFNTQGFAPVVAASDAGAELGLRLETITGEPEVKAGTIRVAARAVETVAETGILANVEKVETVSRLSPGMKKAQEYLRVWFNGNAEPVDVATGVIKDGQARNVWTADNSKMAVAFRVARDAKTQKERYVQENLDMESTQVLVNFFARQQAKAPVLAAAI